MLLVAFLAADDPSRRVFQQPLPGGQYFRFRIGGTRVTLDNLLAHFEAGATPEEIVEQLDTLSLADVYLVRGYCLRHPDDVQEYLRERSRGAEHIKAEIEAESGSIGFVRNILARTNGR